MRMRRATAREIRFACTRYHYARCVPQVQHGYSVFTDDGEFCGCVCFGGGRYTTSVPRMASFKGKPWSWCGSR